MAFVFGLVLGAELGTMGPSPALVSLQNDGRNIVAANGRIVRPFSNCVQVCCITNSDGIMAKPLGSKSGNNVFCSRGPSAIFKFIHKIEISGDQSWVLGGITKLNYVWIVYEDRRLTAVSDRSRGSYNFPARANPNKNTVYHAIVNGGLDIPSGVFVVDTFHLYSPRFGELGNLVVPTPNCM